MTSYDQPSPFGYRSTVADQAGAFLNAVYGWMCGGLLITAVTAWFVAASPTMTTAIATNRILFWILAIVQLGIVFVLSARVQQLAVSTAALLFILYSPV